MASNDDEISVNLTITFPSPKFAEIALKTVEVDQDIKEGRINRSLTLDGDKVHVCVTGTDPKFIRVVVGSILEMFNLSTKTMAVYAPPEEQSTI